MAVFEGRTGVSGSTIGSPPRAEGAGPAAAAFLAARARRADDCGQDACSLLECLGLGWLRSSWRLPANASKSLQSSPLRSLATLIPRVRVAGLRDRPMRRFRLGRPSRASSPSGVEDFGRAVWVGVRGPSRSLAGLERGQRAACRDLLLAVRAAIHPGNPRLRNPSEGSGSLGGQRVCTILDVQARLARSRGFHDWDEPCGDATIRVNSSRIMRILGASGFLGRGSGKKIDSYRRAY